MISLVLKALLALGAVLLFIEGNYQAGFESLLILLLTFLPLVMGKQLRIRIPHEFETLAIVFVYLSLFLGEVQGYYERYWWWDLALHAGSGFLLGILGFLFVYLLNKSENIALHLSSGFIATFAFMFAMTVGVLWEIFEFTMDQLFGMDMQRSATGIVDTMWDLIVNCVGAVVVSILGYGHLETEEIDSFLERMIQRFIKANPRLFHKHQR
jgi:hypothetical protein